MVDPKVGRGPLQELHRQRRRDECSSEDRDVDKKDDAGLCHNVGTYCSSKILGVCTTKKQSYCCYGSKLVRILNEQGKAQLGMAWGKPKDPDCEGFLIAQFQQLDLSQMDFGEVYAEFVDAAKLPDEIEMSIQIQEKIEYYYTLHGGV
ncbi:MAG: conjugal transfer protein TraN [Pseudomonadota bacterium]